MNNSLTILIPARQEEFLNNTIQDILKNIEGDTDIIAVLDGYEPDVVADLRVRVIHNEVSIGQRAATNQACRLSTAKFVMKVDAHCAFDKGFDVKMMNDMKDNWTMAPLMKNLHGFNWICEDGHTRYQSPSGPCQHVIGSESPGLRSIDDKTVDQHPVYCDKPTKKDIIFAPRKNTPNSTSYCFDETPHFQYFNQYKTKQIGDLVESMSLQGSCFMMTREKYWELNICDEKLGSWGSQGIEVAVKTWLSGGSVIINKNTWYAHMFRTQGGDFGFPYEQSGRQVESAKKKVRELFFDNKWDKQIYPLSWLLDKFAPVPGWSEEKLKEIKNWPLPKPLTVGVLYYTDNKLPEPLFTQCQEQIKSCINGTKLVSVSLKPINFGENIVLKAERSVLTMFKQILEGLLRLDTDIVFMAEHDVMYDKSHFLFRPSNKDVFYYNMNLWRVRQTDGFAVKYDHKSLSQLCAYRATLIKEFTERVRRVESEGFNRGGFEPGTRSLRRGGFSDSKAEGFISNIPNIDVRHDKNLSRSKWRQEDFRDQRNCRNWQESMLDKIEGWSELKLG